MVEAEHENMRLAERFKRHAQSMDDFNNEMAGRDVGRISRFVGASSSGSVEGRHRREGQKEQDTQFQMMAATMAYQVLLEETVKALRNAQARISTVLDAVQNMRAVEEVAQDQRAARAARLPDGSSVFRDDNGKVRRDNGEIVAAELAATIIWREDEPSFEEWQFHRERLERLKALEKDAMAAEQNVGDMQARVEDGDAKASIDELEEIRAQAESIADSLEQRLDSLQSHRVETPQADPGFTAIVIPEL
ncbi:MAG: hypothetical protein AAF636_08480 [Pseudomonadota bacterium]